jgi:hypothetical protein
MPICNNPFLNKSAGLLRTNLNTRPALNTLSLVISDLRFWRKAEGITAPFTTERASFKEYIGSDSRTIFDHVSG